MAEVIKFPKHRRLTQSFPGHDDARTAYRNWFSSGAKGDDFTKMKEGMTKEQVKFVNNQVIDDLPRLGSDKSTPSKLTPKVSKNGFKWGSAVRGAAKVAGKAILGVGVLTEILTPPINSNTGRVSRHPVFDNIAKIPKKQKLNPNSNKVTLGILD